MQRNGQDLHKETGAFSIITSSRSTPTGILDFGAAPGGFLSVALEVNPRARALAITLPLSCGGYPVNLPSRPNLTVKFMDVTMLAADMGATEIPSSHPDAANFLSRVFTPDSRPFNLIICGGSVVRAHTRASYRERREASRLICSQLAIGMDHIQNSGTMVVLLHKIERWKNIQLIRRLSRFATIQLCKPKNCHTTRSSVYLVASDVQPSHPEAIAAVDHWKRMWSVATFGTDEQYQSFGKKDKETVEDILREFGEEFVRLGKRAWAIQAAALERQTWTN
jgi:23S rRNA U2552 (ribose-2'-O)-methylase RlmE/FtsJ